MQEYGVDDVGCVLANWRCVNGDALCMHAEVVVGCESRKGGHFVVCAFGMAEGVFYASVERWDSTREERAASESCCDEICAAQLAKDELEHVEIHVHRQRPEKVI